MNDTVQKVDDILTKYLHVEDAVVSMRGVAILMEEFLNGNSFAGPVWAAAESPFSMPANVFGMGLSEQRIKRDFSLDDLNLPEATLPQPDDLKVQPVIPSDAGQDKTAAIRNGLNTNGEAASTLPAVAVPLIPATPEVDDLDKQALPEESNP